MYTNAQTQTQHTPIEPKMPARPSARGATVQYYKLPIHIWPGIMDKNSPLCEFWHIYLCALSLTKKRKTKLNPTSFERKCSKTNENIIMWATRDYTFTTNIMINHFLNKEINIFYTFASQLDKMKSDVTVKTASELHFTFSCPCFCGESIFQKRRWPNIQHQAHYSW